MPFRLERKGTRGSRCVAHGESKEGKEIHREGQQRTFTAPGHLLITVAPPTALPRPAHVSLLQWDREIFAIVAGRSTVPSPLHFLSPQGTVQKIERLKYAPKQWRVSKYNKYILSSSFKSFSSWDLSSVYWVGYIGSLRSRRPLATTSKSFNVTNLQLMY